MLGWGQLLTLFPPLLELWIFFFLPSVVGWFETSRSPQILDRPNPSLDQYLVAQLQSIRLVTHLDYVATR